MKERAYQLQSVNNEIYCSPDAQHSVIVSFIHDGRLIRGHYWFEKDVLLSSFQSEGKYAKTLKVPAYFVKVIRGAVFKQLSTAQVYEYDNQRKRVYTDLRYHPDDWIQRTIERWDAKS